MRSPSPRSPGPKSFKVGAVFVRKKIIRESSDVKSFGSLFASQPASQRLFRVQDVVGATDEVAAAPVVVVVMLTSLLLLLLMWMLCV